MKHISEMTDQERRDNIEIVTRYANSNVPPGGHFVVIICDTANGTISHGSNIGDEEKLVELLRITADVLSKS